jgi:P-aminobenzoate N-oxygenase AurF
VVAIDAILPPPGEASGPGDVERALGYLLILAVEELLDVCNRATTKDERVHSVSRGIAKLHVLEEARHVSFARSYLQELWPSLDEAARASATDVAPVAVSVIADLVVVVNPDVYTTLGIEGGLEAAKANRHHRDRIVRSLARLTDFLTELEVITEATRPNWEAAGLVEAGLVEAGLAPAAA